MMVRNIEGQCQETETRETVYIQYSRRREGTDTEGQGGGTKTREPQRHGIFLNISVIIHRVKCKLKN